jgi:Mrp family chromosome partitioning ATPase
LSERRGGRLPEGGRTLPIGTKVDLTERSPKITPPRGTDTLDGRTTAPFPATKPGDEEPTRAMGGSEVASKFVDPADPRLRTAVHPSRTVKDASAQTPSRDPRDRILPDQRTTDPRLTDPRLTDPRLTDPRLAEQRGSAEAPAAGSLPSVPPQEREKTKVWVATHKPPVDPDRRLILLREPDSAQAASFRVLRHRLEQRGNPRVIAVTSAEEGEGKTTCAANLAMALGECERARVLLVEANLRNPSLAALFGFLPPTCFSLQLQQHKEKPLDPWSVVEAFTPSLHVIAVKPGQESRPLLDGPAFAHAMDMLRNAGYDYIVLDTPPVLGSADVNLVEDTCDGVLLCGWARRSSGRALRRAVEQLAPAKILGITLLDV